MSNPMYAPYKYLISFSERRFPSEAYVHHVNAMLVKVVIILLDHGLVNPMACIDLNFKLTNLPMSGELWRPQRLHCNGQNSWLSLCHRNQNGENPFFSVTTMIVKQTQS